MLHTLYSTWYLSPLYIRESNVFFFLCEYVVIAVLLLEPSGMLTVGDGAGDAPSRGAADHPSTISARLLRTRSVRTYGA